MTGGTGMTAPTGEHNHRYGATGISQRLKRARVHEDLTQVALARRTGVGLATIRRIEQTDGEPRLATARTLAAALDVSVAWLVFGLGPWPVGPDEEAPH